MKIISIKSLPAIGIRVEFDNGEFAELYPFGETIYTTTSEGLYKKTLDDFKRSVKVLNWNIKDLETIWIG